MNILSVTMKIRIQQNFHNMYYKHFILSYLKKIFFFSFFTINEESEIEKKNVNIS